jgi:hypothetical protein
MRCVSCRYWHLTLVLAYITERPAKVAKKDITTTELKGSTTRASFHDNSLDGEHARGLTPPETAEKAGVASTNDTTTPRVTKHPPIHRQETTRRPCMVSPELTYVPDPPSFRMPHPTAAVSDDDKQKHHSRNKVSIVYLYALGVYRYILTYCNLCRLDLKRKLR